MLTEANDLTYSFVTADQLEDHPSVGPSIWTDRRIVFHNANKLAFLTAGFQEYRLAGKNASQPAFRQRSLFECRIESENDRAGASWLFCKQAARNSIQQAGMLP